MLRQSRKIGVAWNADKPAWMGFVAFGPDGRKVASDGPGSPGDVSGDLTLWSFPQGKLIRRLPGRPGAISPDWKYYADHNHVRRIGTGEPVISLQDDVFATYAFSRGGEHVAISAGRNRAGARIRIHALASGKEVVAFGRRLVFSLAFGPGEHVLASGGWDSVTFWNPHTGSRLGTAHWAGRYVEALAFSNDGKLLAAGTDAGGLLILDAHGRGLPDILYQRG